MEKCYTLLAKEEFDMALIRSCCLRDDIVSGRRKCVARGLAAKVSMVINDQHLIEFLALLSTIPFFGSDHYKSLRFICNGLEREDDVLLERMSGNTVRSVLCPAISWRGIVYAVIDGNTLLDCSNRFVRRKPRHIFRRRILTA